MALTKEDYEFRRSGQGPVALDELCELCEEPAVAMEAGRPLCCKHRGTKQERFEEKKFSDFEPEDGFEFTAVRHIPIPKHPIEPARKQAEIQKLTAPVPQAFIDSPHYEIFNRKEKRMENATANPKLEKKDVLADIDIAEAVKLWKSGMTGAELGAHFDKPSWYFYQSKLFLGAKKGMLRDREPGAPKADGRHAPKVTERQAAAKVQSNATVRQNVREDLRQISLQLEKKIDNLAEALQDIRAVLAMLEKYPDIL